MKPTNHGLADINVLPNDIHLLDHPAWIFDESTLKIVDANQQAMEFCMYERHEFIGLSITDLWYGEDLDDILRNIDLYSAERSFFGDLKHRKKNGEIVIMRIRATRLSKSASLWVVHLVVTNDKY